MAGSRALLYGVSVSIAILVAIISAFITSYRVFIIPCIVYLISLGANILSNYLACDGITPEKSAKRAIVPTIMALLMLGLLNIAPSIIKPVSAIMPMASDVMKSTVGNIFYIFWAVLYGQMIAGGFSQIC